MKASDPIDNRGELPREAARVSSQAPSDAGRLDHLAARLSELLGLCSPPVAFSRLERAPAGIDVYDGPDAAACAMWRVAEQKVFYAPSRSHEGCAIGMRTLALEMSEEAMEQLGEAAQAMCAAGYLSESEPARLPSLEGANVDGVLYGPLGAFPIAPDFVVVWVTPAAAMLLAEALESVRWDRAGGVALSGRPACAALPLAQRSGRAAISLGCTGMRIRAGIDSERMLAVLPGRWLGQCAQALQRAALANASMSIYYNNGGASS